MNYTNFSIVRCVPDPARGEMLNIGVVVWNDETFVADIDPEAARRAIDFGSAMARDALRSAKEIIEARIGRLGKLGPGVLERFIDNQPGFPLLLARPSVANVKAAGKDGLKETLQRLMERLVSTTDPGMNVSPTANLGNRFEARIEPLLAGGKVKKAYPIETTRTGVYRKMDYFVNSSANVAMDLLRVDWVSEERLQERADAEAFKISDILASSFVTRYYVFCTAKGDSSDVQVGKGVRQALEDVGGRVITNFDEAATTIEKAAIRL